MYAGVKCIWGSVLHVDAPHSEAWHSGQAQVQCVQVNYYQSMHHGGETRRLVGGQLGSWVGVPPWPCQWLGLADAPALDTAGTEQWYSVLP